MQHWFVYYKLDAVSAAALAPRLREVLGQVADATGVRGRLMRRADEAGERSTLMEVYEGIAQPQAFAAALEEAVDRAGLPPALRAQRRTERFEDC